MTYGLSPGTSATAGGRSSSDDDPGRGASAAGGQSLRPSDVRVWLLVSASASALEARGDTLWLREEAAWTGSSKRLMLPAFPCYHFPSPRLQSLYWTLLGPLE